MKKFHTQLASILLFALGMCNAPNAAAESAMSPAVQWVTLGTAGGPIVHADRSQPANLLSIGEHHWLVDCGDGALERLASVGYQPTRIDRVFISHLHQDHVAGLQGLLGLRWMQGASGTLTIYGPKGTDVLVDGLLRSMQPLAAAGLGKFQPAPGANVKVVIVTGGTDLLVDGVRVRTVRNSHFDDAHGHSNVESTESVSYRFDTPSESVGYTGDTGTSEAVASLFKGVDMVVSEVIDLEGTIATINGPHSPMPPQVRPALIEHLKAQHLTPQQAGALASMANAKRLVLTHLAITAPTSAVEPKLREGAHETFKGDIAVAHDLDKF